MDITFGDEDIDAFKEENPENVDMPVPGSAVFYYGTGLAPPNSFLSYPGHQPVDSTN